MMVNIWALYSKMVPAKKTSEELYTGFRTLRIRAYCIIVIAKSRRRLIMILSLNAGGVSWIGFSCGLLWRANIILTVLAKTKMKDFVYGNGLHIKIIV